MTVESRRCGRWAFAAVAVMLWFGPVSGGLYAAAEEPPDRGGMMSDQGPLRDALTALESRLGEADVEAANLCTAAEEKKADDDKDLYNECNRKRDASVRKRYDNILVDNKKLSDDKRLSRVTPFEMKGDKGAAPETYKITAQAVALDVCGYLIELGGAYCDDIVGQCKRKCDSAERDYLNAKAGHGVLKSKRGGSQDDANLD
ncbi:hypothetical protein ACW9HQ_44465, partial [Nocardia gipuzkoensis]